MFYGIPGVMVWSGSTLIIELWVKKPIWPVAYPEINYGGCSDFQETIQQQGPIEGMPLQNLKKINIK